MVPWQRSVVPATHECGDRHSAAAFAVGAAASAMARATSPPRIRRIGTRWYSGVGAAPARQPLPQAAERPDRPLHRVDAHRELVHRVEHLLEQDAELRHAYVEAL